MQVYVRSVLSDFERELEARAQAGAVRIGVASRMRFNPTLESANLFVPGLIALVLTLVSALMTAISLSREKELGTLEVLLVSPLRPWQIIVGKVRPVPRARLRDHLPGADRGAPRLRRADARQRDAAARGERALHDRLAVARRAVAARTQLAARRDARRARRAR